MILLVGILCSFPTAAANSSSSATAAYGNGVGLMAPQDECVANVILIRHGEKPRSKAYTWLTVDGKNRAQYLARCATNKTAALSLGPPTFVAASTVRPGKSSRPRDTMAPLASNLGLPLDLSVDKEDYQGFAKMTLAQLSCGGTLMAAWQHDDIPSLAAALQAPNAKQGVFSKWPEACDSSTWDEPAYIVPSDSCYDLIWRIQFTRTSDGASWRAGNITTFHEGFGGSATSLCAQDLAPVGSG